MTETSLFLQDVGETALAKLLKFQAKYAGFNRNYSYPNITVFLSGTEGRSLM